VGPAEVVDDGAEAAREAADTAKAAPAPPIPSWEEAVKEIDRAAGDPSLWPIYEYYASPRRRQ
jgi:hypothetical protein